MRLAQNRNAEIGLEGKKRKNAAVKTPQKRQQEIPKN